MLAERRQALGLTRPLLVAEGRVRNYILHNCRGHGSLGDRRTCGCLTSRGPRNPGSIFLVAGGRSRLTQSSAVAAIKARQGHRV